MGCLSFKDCYANKLDLTVMEITNGKYLVSRTFFKKRINAEMDKTPALSIILEYKSTKREPLTPAEKKGYAKAYSSICYDIAERYRESLK